MSDHRYIARVSPRLVRAEDEWWPEPRERLDVIVVEEGASPTGLVDQHGVPIVRLPNRGPLGFCR